MRTTFMRMRIVFMIYRSNHIAVIIQVIINVVILTIIIILAIIVIAIIIIITASIEIIIIILRSRIARLNERIMMPFIFTI